jgi:hypothetical protein
VNWPLTVGTVISVVGQCNALTPCPRIAVAHIAQKIVTPRTNYVMYQITHAQHACVLQLLLICLGVLNYSNYYCGYVLGCPRVSFCRLG